MFFNVYQLLRRRTFVKVTIVYVELTVKAASAQTVVAAKENGLTTEGKESPPKPAPKKSRRHKFFKSKEVGVD